MTLSVASTVVLLRTLENKGILDSINGRIAIGWLVIEDLVTVLAGAFAGALWLAWRRRSAIGRQHLEDACDHAGLGDRLCGVHGGNARHLSRARHA